MQGCLPDVASNCTNVNVQVKPKTKFFPYILRYINIRCVCMRINQHVKSILFVCKIVLQPNYFYILDFYFQTGKIRIWTYISGRREYLFCEKVNQILVDMMYTLKVKIQLAQLSAGHPFCFWYYCVAFHTTKRFGAAFWITS